MNRTLLDNYVSEFYPEYDSVVVFEDLDDALVGVGVGQDGVPKSVYDQDKIIEILMRDMTEEEAWEYFSFNIEGTKFSNTEVIYLTSIKKIESV
jgi:hypothetical protein